LKSNTYVLGALCWLSSVQFFITQLWVALAWRAPFSLAHNFISDLGNTRCGSFNGESHLYVCSPRHAWMNASFVLLGFTILAGGVLTHDSRRPGLARQFVRASMVVAGTGGMLVGCFPENENLSLHSLGAGAYFLFANIGLVMLGASAAEGIGRIEGVMIGLGITGISAAGLFFSGHYLGLGVGGMERVLVYPLPLALTLCGALLLAGGPARTAATPPGRKVQELA
jgi:hypothetical membrane protein